MNDVSASVDLLKTQIYSIRGIRVMLDKDLAALYGVMTGNLNKAVKRNSERFPADFMFQLTRQEVDLIFQTGISNWGGTRKLPYAFTEHGIAMLSGVLQSKLAIEINIRIMRTFIELRHMIADHPEYLLLKETVKSIELKVETIEANHLVDTMMMSGKVTKLSQDVLAFRDDLQRISVLFDQFQNSHILIKRPEEGSNHG